MADVDPRFCIKFVLYDTCNIYANPMTICPTHRKGHTFDYKKNTGFNKKLYILNVANREVQWPVPAWKHDALCFMSRFCSVLELQLCIVKRKVHYVEQ